MTHDDGTGGAGSPGTTRPRTLVAFHAHPDDEALLTSGTMARAAAEGHRVVLVLATDGGLGLAAERFHEAGRPHGGARTQDGTTGQDGTTALGALRLEEAQASAQALGTHRIEWLGYADSGSGPDLPDNPVGAVRFCRAPLEEAAERLAAIVRTERADVLLGYDANGGYGHRDHVRVHQVARRAAQIAGTPRLLEATVPRDALLRGIRLASRVYRFPPDFDPTSFERAYSASAEITHRIDVHRFIRAKRASMAAHASQASGGEGQRTLATFLRIPRPLFDLVFGREWFVDPYAAPGSPLAESVFEGLG